MLGSHGCCRCWGWDRRCGLLLAPPLKGVEILRGFQGGGTGILQVLVDNSIGGSLGAAGSFGASWRGEESMVRLEKREKELADSFFKK